MADPVVFSANQQLFVCLQAERARGEELRARLEKIRERDMPQAAAGAVKEKTPAAVREQKRLSYAYHKKHGVDLTCISCNQKFETVALFITHISSARRKHKATYPCAQKIENVVCACGYRPYSLTTYRSHLQRVKREHSYFCDRCGSGFVLQEPLRRHRAGCVNSLK